MHNVFFPIRGGAAVVLTVACLASSGGCTSVIGSAYLREAWLDAVEQAADRKAVADQSQPAAAAVGAEGTSVAEATDDAAVSGAVRPSDQESADIPPAWATVEAALAAADERLSNAGGLADAARDALAATLEATPRQDWRVVVEEFTAALMAARGDTAERRRPAEPAATPVRGQDDAGADAGGAAPPPARVSAAESAEPPAPMPPEEPLQETAAAPSPQTPVAESAEFSVRNACFATRVRGWGVVDRFETSQFAAGQEVIVYFELDALSGQSSPAGHTTRVDTALTLVGGDGAVIERWSFEPLEETCRSRRHDYFARYLVTLPATLPPGACHLEISVRDAVADRLSRASLPLEIVNR